MDYPADWTEFEDTAEAFLFYNPDVWTGNFRISAYRGNATFGRDSVEQELRENPSAQRIKIGERECAYSQEMFMEEGTYYVSHIWVLGIGDLAFECTFTTGRGKPVDEARQVIASLQARQPGVKYPAELIPVRVSEIYQINEAYEWVEKTVKDVLKKDFQGMEEDVLLLRVGAGIYGSDRTLKQDEVNELVLSLCALDEVSGICLLQEEDGVMSRDADVLRADQLIYNIVTF